ncbi:MAG: HEPN domain-containing protein [Chloroflexota bacterium]
MSPRQKRPSTDFAAEASRWLAFARGDLESAEALLDTLTPNRNVGYLAQQATEKALKSVILLANSPFEMTHDLTAIAAQLPRDFVPPIALVDLAWMADLETSARYPDDGDSITRDDAERAVTLARAVLDAVADRFVARGVDPRRIDPE